MLEWKRPTKCWVGSWKIKITYLDGFRFISKWHEQPHPKLVHWMLLNHSNPFLGLRIVRFALLGVVFYLDFNPFYFLHLCGLLFRLWSFYFLFLFPCWVFFLFKFFIYSLVDFLRISMPNPRKPYVQVVTLPQKSFQLLNYVVARGLSSDGSILLKVHRFHKKITQMGHVLRCACHLLLFCIKSHPNFRFSSMLLNCWPTMELPFVL